MYTVAVSVLYQGVCTLLISMTLSFLSLSSHCLPTLSKTVGRRMAGMSTNPCRNMNAWEFLMSAGKLLELMKTTSFVTVTLLQ